MARPKGSTKKAVSGAKNVKPAPAPVEEAAHVVETKVEAANVITPRKVQTYTVMFRDPVGIRFRVADKNGIEHVVEINGYAHNLRGLDKGILVPGWGLTHNVDAELWDAIVEKYGRVLPAFTRGMLKAMPDVRSAEAEAENLKDVKSSLDPVDIEKTHTAEV